MLFLEASNWRAGMQDVSAAIDDTFGEIVTVTPVQAGKPNFPGAPEPERAVTVTAVFTSPAKRVDMGKPPDNWRRESGGAVHISSSDPSFSFRSGTLPFAMSQGFRIQVCRTGELFEVKDVKPDSVARIVCTVVQLGRQSERR